jgi:hypothetical protein
MTEYSSRILLKDFFNNIAPLRSLGAISGDGV